MKNIILLVLLAALFTMCTEKEVEQTGCSVPATVRDLTGLDGCGWVFELNDGTVLEPYWQWGWCGTPPQPEGAVEDPLFDFEYENGKTVFIGYEPLTMEIATTCMADQLVKITCIRERVGSTVE